MDILANFTNSSTFIFYYYYIVLLRAIRSGRSCFSQLLEHHTLLEKLQKLNIVDVIYFDFSIRTFSCKITEVQHLNYFERLKTPNYTPSGDDVSVMHL